MEALTSCSGNFENLFETSSLADSDAGLTFEVDNGNALVGVVGFVGVCCLGLNKGFDASSHYLGEGSGDVIDMSKNFAVDGFAVGNVSMILVLVVVSVSVSSECLLVPTKKRKACLGSMDKSEEGEGDEIVDMQSFLILEIADEGDVFAIVGVFGIDKRWINLGCKASSMKKSNINMTSVCKKIGNWFLRSSCSEVTCPEKVVGVRDELPQAQ